MKKEVDFLRELTRELYSPNPNIEEIKSKITNRLILLEQKGNSTKQLLNG